MSQVWHFIKLAGAVIFGFAGAVCLVLQLIPLAVGCGITSLAFSHMPE